MLYWKNFNYLKSKTCGKKKLFDNNIFTFDIETSSFFRLNNKIYSSLHYKDLTKKEQEHCSFFSVMYIWMLGINDTIYYGRTWEELKKFLKRLEEFIPEKKYIFVHNFSYEFQFLRGEFNFENVFARKMRKPMKAELEDFNIEFRCTYYMTNASLDQLPKLFKLPVKKLKGNLDYYKIRTPATPLTIEELDYCENDCLVLYYYILEELKTYETVKNIPLTSTGHVRRELKERIEKDYSYKNIVKKCSHIDGKIYNLLLEAFSGGYTHANWIYAGEILENVDSYDFTSSYPYVMVSEKYPMSNFKKCYIKNINDMRNDFSYIIKVKFYNLKSKYYNNFISSSKCRKIRGAAYDNGRIISASELEMTLTDIDFKFLLESYYIENYEIIESYFTIYDYLPKVFVDFILEKYIKKTSYKNVEDMEVEYMKEKNKFNALYGMCVTNNIRDEVIYYNDIGWDEQELTDEEIKEKLKEEEKKAFLTFSWGVWVTAYARRNLLENVIKLDDKCVYCDTDSIKLVQNYDKDVIKNYNNNVIEKIKQVAKIQEIDFENFQPKDTFGVNHLLGLFEKEGEGENTYKKFITQGAKKYAYEDEKGLHITVAGVPKNGYKSLKGSLENFQDDLVFKFENTGKLLIQYLDEMSEIEVVDYSGNIYNCCDKTGAVLIPTTYVLSKSYEYAELITAASSRRAKLKDLDI